MDGCKVLWKRLALCANAHISESRYGAPDFVCQFRCGPLALIDSQIFADSNDECHFFGLPA